MDSLRVLNVFMRVAETGSFSAVARELRTTQPSVSRAVAQLEKSLGARLLTRTTRNVALTDVGRALYERAGPPVRELGDLAAELQAGSTAPRGTVKLAAPASLGRHLVLPVVTAFVNEFPQVKVDLSLTDRSVDLVEEGVDLAVRVGAASSSAQVVRVLGTSVQRLVATPRYLKGRPPIATPKDLERHQHLARRSGGRVLLSLGPIELPAESVRLSADDVDTVHDAALAHAGVAILPAWLVDEDVRRKRLVRLLPRLAMPGVPVSVVLPAGRQVPLRVRALIDRLVASIGRRLAEGKG
jgi:DNA-binding transcriptional LysR family regulator